MIMTENFPKLRSDTKLLIQQSQKIAAGNIKENKEINKTTPMHNIFKLYKIKNKEIYSERSQRRKNTLLTEEER